MKTILGLLTISLLLGHGVLDGVWAQACPHFGTDVTDRLHENSGQGLVLNLESPASCNGTLTEWHYCFYRFDTDTNRVAYFAVYRREDSTYNLVDGSYMRINRRGSTSAETCSGQSPPLCCGTVAPDQLITVQEGDVLAACRLNSVPLGLVAEEAEGHTLHFADPLHENCVESQIQNVDTNSIQPSSDFLLHLYASIEPSLPQPSSTSTVAFLPSSSLTPADIASQTMEPAGETLISFVVTRTITAATSSPSPSEGSIVQPTPSSVTGSIPITTSSPSPSEGSIVQPTPSSVTGSIPITTSVAIAVRSIAVISSQSTVPIQSTEPVPSSSNGGLSPGIVVAIVVSLLITIAIACAVLGVLLCNACRRHGYFYPLGKKRDSERFSGIDNAIYGSGDAVANIAAERDALNQQYEMLVTSYKGPLSSLKSSRVPDYGYTMEQQTTGTTPSTLSIPCVSDPYYSSILDSHDIYERTLAGNSSDENPYCVPANKEEDLYAQLRSFGIWNIAKKEIEVISHIGSGQFGNVSNGTWKTTTGVLEVAVKTLVAGASKMDKVKFLQEAAIMAQFRHPNIVFLHGVVAKEEPPMLVIELVHKGDLRGFLSSMKPDPGQQVPPDTPRMLLEFSRHVALGMQYLSSKGFVHRDLAARNILVSKDNICKVSDFGLSRDLAQDTYYVSHGGMIPVKWTAPEALNYKKYSTASDVWSYGCLLYEIWSLGHKPFEKFGNSAVLRKVDSGYRLPPPPGCPRMIYEIMTQCWNPNSSLRPTFRELLLALMEYEEAVLAIPMDALSAHVQAGMLGAPLEVGEFMYQDLQQQYRSA